ncbi:MAG: aldo/keto reductase, partial [Albidovulum sp.]
SAYLGIAARAGLDPAQMALAWTMTRPFPIVPILGATTVDQLDIALGAADLTLSEAVLDEIAAAHKAHPMPY